MKKFFAYLLSLIICVTLVSCGNKTASVPEVEEVVAKPKNIIDAAAEYTDVNKGDWFEESVSWAATEGIVEESKPTEFGVKTPVSTQQLVVSMWRAAGAPGQVVSAKYVADSDPDSDVSKATEWAVENGIIDDKGVLSTYDSASRLDAVEMMYSEADSPKPSGVNEFSDAVGLDAVNWARESSIAYGIGNNLFDPNGDCTKAMIATFLFRAK